MAIPDKSFDELLLTHANGEKVALTTNKLESWFARVERANPNTHTSDDDIYLSSQFISRIGLQSAKDVLVFLNSPAGQSIKEMIGAQLAEIAALREDEAVELREQEAMRHRIAFLLLGLLYARDAKAHDLNAIIQNQLDKLVRQHEKQVIKEMQTATKIDTQKMVEAYAHMANELETALNEKFVEAEALEAKKAALEKHGEDLTAKYQTFEEHINALDGFISTLGDLNNKANLSTINTSPITEKLAMLTQQLDMNAIEVSQLLESETPGNDIEVKKLLRSSNAINLQVGLFKEILSIISGELHLYNQHGDPATSYNDADYLLPRTKKIVKEGEKYYLLPSNKDVKDLSIADKAEAETNYQRLKLQPQMMSVKKVIGHNRDLEHGEHNERKKTSELRSQITQRELYLLSNQLTQVQAARSFAEAMINQAQTANPSMAPIPASPTPSAPMSTPRSTNTQVASTFRHIVLLMKNAPTTEGIIQLKDGFAQHPDLQKALPFVDRLKAGTPIPEQTMRSLLANIERFGVSASKPNVGPIASQKKESAPTAPTPFSTKPPGF